jgi:hypothetical protein
MKTREEHLQFIKERAMEHVRNGNLLGAINSMVSDLDQHPETSSKDIPVELLTQKAQVHDRWAIIHQIQSLK